MGQRVCKQRASESRGWGCGEGACQQAAWRQRVALDTTLRSLMQTHQQCFHWQTAGLTCRASTTGCRACASAQAPPAAAPLVAMPPAPPAAAVAASVACTAACTAGPMASFTAASMSGLEKAGAGAPEPAPALPAGRESGGGGDGRGGVAGRTRSNLRHMQRKLRTHAFRTRRTERGPG